MPRTATSPPKRMNLHAIQRGSSASSKARSGTNPIAGRFGEPAARSGATLATRWIGRACWAPCFGPPASRRATFAEHWTTPQPAARFCRCSDRCTERSAVQARPPNARTRATIRLCSPSPPSISGSSTGQAPAAPTPKPTPPRPRLDRRPSQGPAFSPRSPPISNTA